MADWWREAMPTLQQDLSIEDRIFKGDLVVGDPDLVHVIKDALMNGSNGMLA